MDTMRIFSPTGMLGYGFPEQSFDRGLSQNPDLIAVDAGSTDPGPYYLGSGRSFTSRHSVKRDLQLILTKAVPCKIPVIVSSAGGCGAKPHVDWCVEIIQEIVRENRLTFDMAVIYADIPKELLLQKLKDGKVSPMDCAPPLTRENVLQSTHLVAQMGKEPIMEALRQGAQVIVTGRCYDPVPFAALPVLKGFDEGLALHMGKILECACVAASPGSASDCMMGYLEQDCFYVEPTSDQRICSVLSISAHTMYEKTNPAHLPGPGGALDLQDVRFTQQTDRRVKVTGSRYVPDSSYTIKLEGARQIGFRTIAVAGVRDPIMIAQIDPILFAVKDALSKQFDEDYILDFKLYGKNGVMGSQEPEILFQGHELGIVIDVVAHSQDAANAICGFARSSMLHYGYEGRIATAGNLALPFSPAEFEGGGAYSFSVYHLMKIDDPLELFPIYYNKLQ